MVLEKFVQRKDSLEIPRLDRPELGSSTTPCPLPRCEDSLHAIAKCASLFSASLKMGGKLLLSSDSGPQVDSGSLKPAYNPSLPRKLHST